jgi:hypothetical protein
MSDHDAPALRLIDLRPYEHIIDISVMDIRNMGDNSKPCPERVIMKAGR